MVADALYPQVRAWKHLLWLAIVFWVLDEREIAGWLIKRAVIVKLVPRVPSLPVADPDRRPASPSLPASPLETVSLELRPSSAETAA